MLSLRKVVAEVIDTANDRAGAVQVIARKCDEDGELMRAFAEVGIDQLVRDYYSDLRRNISAREPSARIVVGVVEEQRVSARIQRIEFWEQYTLWGKERLRYAVKPALLESVKQRRIQAAGNIRRAKFEEAVATALPNSQTTVEQHFALQDIEKIAKANDVLYEMADAAAA